MEFNRLDTAIKLYEEIKYLDAKIIELDKIAMIVAEGNVEISFDMNVTDLTKKDAESNKVTFDEDGSIKTSLGYKSMFSNFLIPSSLMYIGTENLKENKSTTNLKQNISETTSLMILGYLLCGLTDKRNQLIAKLTKMGVNI